MCGEYVRGKLALAGVDLSLPLGTWLDAVYAVWIDAPHELLDKAMQKRVIAQARVRPKEARETWGMRPEHQRMAGKLTSAERPPALGPVKGAGDAQDALQRAQRRMAGRRR